MNVELHISLSSGCAGWPTFTNRWLAGAVGVSAALQLAVLCLGVVAVRRWAFDDSAADREETTDDSVTTGNVRV